MILGVGRFSCEQRDFAKQLKGCGIGFGVLGEQWRLCAVWRWGRPLQRHPNPLPTSLLCPPTSMELSLCLQSIGITISHLLQRNQVCLTFLSTVPFINPSHSPALGYVPGRKSESHCSCLCPKLGHQSSSSMQVSPYLCLHFVLRILLTSYLFLAFEIMVKIEQCIIMKWRGEDAQWVLMQPLAVVALGLCQHLVLPILLRILPVSLL